MRPAVRIILAPIARRGPQKRDDGFDAPKQGETSGRTIWIDPRLPHVAKTLLHELIHVQHPGWCEERVSATEEYRWTHMSWRKKAELYRLLGSAEIEGEA